jgi:hypothetical protein
MPLTARQRAARLMVLFSLTVTFLCFDAAATGALPPLKALGEALFRTIPGLEPMGAEMGACLCAAAGGGAAAFLASLFALPWLVRRIRRAQLQRMEAYLDEQRELQARRPGDEDRFVAQGIWPEEANPSDRKTTPKRHNRQLPPKP